MLTDSTIWRIIPGFVQYEVSNRGEVRRRVASSRGHPAGYLLTPDIDKDGYAVYDLWIDGKQHNRGAHTLVARAFIGECPASKQQINHKDGVKTNNSPENLEWVTCLENHRHAIAHGLRSFEYLRGEGNGMAKLTAEKVLAIRALRGIANNRTIGAWFGIHCNHVNRIWRRELWKHL